MAEKEIKGTYDAGTFEAEVVQATIEMKNEGDRAKDDRLEKNRENWDMYNLIGDFSRKTEGQSALFLSKNAMAAEQIVSLVKGALVNNDKWFEPTRVGLIEHRHFRPGVVRELMMLYLDDADVVTKISDAVKVGIHESRATIKVVGEDVVKTKRFFTKGKGKKLMRLEEREWKLKLSVIPAEDYTFDPHAEGGTPLYEIHSMLVNYHQLVDRCKTEMNPSGVYDLKEVEKLEGDGEDEDDSRKARNRDMPTNLRMGRRKAIRVWECYGTILDRNGAIMRDANGTPMRNVVWSIANERVLIRRPEPNPRWIGRSPIVSAPILRTPHAPWPKALMDGGTKLNEALNELFNLMVDGGLGTVHGIKQVRPGWLDNPQSIANGIPTNKTLVVSDTAPQGAKVLELCAAGSVPPEVLSFFNIASGLHAENCLVNELRVGGMPQKQVRATEVVEASQAISGVFDGVARDLEEQFIEKLLENVWMDILQNVDEFPYDDLVRIAGEESAAYIRGLTPKQRFEEAALGFKFTMQTVSSVVMRMRDFQRFMQLTSVIGANPQLFAEFEKEYSMSKLIGKLIQGLNIDPEHIRLTPKEIKVKEQLQQQMQLIMQQAQMQAQLAGEQGKSGPKAGKAAPLPEEGRGVPGAEVGSGAGM